MKTLIISFLLAMLPMTQFSVQGNLNIRPGGSTSISISPYDPSYRYEWGFDDDLEKVERYFDISFSGNSLYVTAHPDIAAGLVNFTCVVYDSNGNYLGSAGNCIVAQY